MGRTGSVRVGSINQLIMAPAKIAPEVRNRTGVVMFLSSFAVWWMVFEFDGHHAAETMNRVE